MKAADPLRVAALEQALDNDEDLEQFGDATFRGFADAQFQKIEHAVLNDDDELLDSPAFKISAADERVAALGDALENGGDLWQFGTATFKGFADMNFDDEELKQFEGLLDPNDPMLQSDSPLGREQRLEQVDSALLSGGDLSHFGTRTLKAALQERSDLTVPHEEIRMVPSVKAPLLPASKYENGNGPSAAPAMSSKAHPKLAPAHTDGVRRLAAPPPPQGPRGRRAPHPRAAHAPHAAIAVACLRAARASRLSQEASDGSY